MSSNAGGSASSVGVAGEPPSRSAGGGKPAVKSKVSASASAINASKFGYDQARHLLWRAGFGGTPEQIQTLASWGPQKAVDYLIEYEKVPFVDSDSTRFDGSIMRPLTPDERAALQRARRSNDTEAVARYEAERQKRQMSDRKQVRDVQHWWMKRMIETPRPLEEKLTLLWHGHFATSYRTIEDSYHMYRQNEFFRKNASGSFGDLLFGIIRDPAMIAYLDNNDSSKNRPNENLARELMELFSLGVGNYTEKDIKEGARALTGYTFEDDEFVFQKNNHDDGGKAILGRRGNLDGDGFVSAILEQRACASFVARKLYRFFAADYPTGRPEIDAAAEGMIRGLASTLLRNKYQLRPALRELFLSEHFYDPALAAEQIKSPVQLVVGAVRSLGAPPRDLSVLLDAMNLMGQNLLFPPSVKGWDGGRAWINTATLFVRQNILAYLLTGKTPTGYDAMAGSEKYDPMKLLTPLDAADPTARRDPAKVADFLTRFALGRPSPESREPLLAFLASHSNTLTPDVLTGLLLLITTMPEYQLC
ncbi:MAG: DUF1800 domain-containing protein [Phycisphaerae bacterium]|nr:DUF1800 domain-containing protein [Phycisphaerae bacterium]